jgi:hypothetical protein
VTPVLHQALKAIFSRLALLLLALLPLGTACSEGGGDDRPSSEVTIAASHQMFGSRGRPLFNKFPVDPLFMLSDRGTLILRDDSSYTVKQDAGTSSPQRYTIEKDGTFTVTVPVSNRPAPTHFVRAYALEGDTQAYFFTDRFAQNSNDAVGLIWGTRLVTGTPDLEGDWHVFSQHVIFSQSQVQDPDNVGRTMAGTIAIDSTGNITGAGKESTKADLTFTGSAQSFADGAVTLTLVYTEGTNKDSRVFRAGNSNAIILGLDEDETDGETGLIGLLEKRTGAKDLTKFAGSYTIGMHTIFVNPVRAGIDGAVGTITFNEQGGFKLDATGQQTGAAKAFSYSGNYTLADDGTLVLTVGGTSETWMGAVDQEYKVLLVADNFVESRSGNEPPELNLFLGIREPVVK